MTAKQIDRLLSILDRAVKVAEHWADREYPESDETAEVTISHAGENHRPQTLEEYKAFEPEEDSFRRLSRMLRPQT